jgi:outer membrane protein insertion porin family
MRYVRFLSCLTAVAFLSVLAHAECREDHRSNKSAGVLITELTLSGTHSVRANSAASSDMMGSCFDENSEELAERIRYLFQNKGYFECEIESVRIRANDPLAVPKVASVEAVVSEGRRFRLGEIRFEGNHAFESSELRDKFSMKKGDFFARNEIGGGLEGVRDLYTAKGFIDIVMVPDVVKSSEGTLVLSINVTEGRQYHMGVLEIFAKKELAERLRTQWEIPEGAVFDLRYVEKFIAQNRLIRPAEFTGRTFKSCGIAGSPLLP